MSVTFHSNVATETLTKEATPCLCSQMAELWSDAMHGTWNDAVREDLKREANPSCPFCKGTGIEMREESDAPTLNLSNEGTLLLFKALGLNHDLTGDLPIPEARRAIMRARSRSDLSPFTCGPEVKYSAPRTEEDGSVVLRPLRLYSPGVDTNRMASFITRFANFVEAAVTRGATTIHWD